MKPQALLLLTVILSAPSLAEETSLPATVDLAAAMSLVLEVERAIVDVTIDEEAAPSLKASPASEKARGATLDVEAGRTLTVRRRAEGDEGTVRLELTLRPGQTLELAGRELDLKVSGPPRAAGEQEPVEPAVEGEEPTSGDDLESSFEGVTWGFQVRLADSTAEIAGLAGLRLVAALSDVQLRETGGPATVELEGGSLASEDHQGALRVKGAGAEIAVTRHRGGLLFELEETKLDILTAEGSYRGEAHGGGVSLVDWSGDARIGGEAARIEVRDGRAPVQVALGGRELDASVNRFEGPLTAVLDSGRLTGGALAGDLEISAHNEARISLSELRGDKASFQLTAGAAADLLDVDSELEADISARARLAVDGVRQIGAKVVDGEIVADNIDMVRMISVKNSRFDLDFTQLRRHPTIAQRGTTEGRLKIAQPCVVRMAGPVEVIDEKVVVTGCDLVTLASRKEERMRGQKGYPEGTTVLVTNIEEKSGPLEIDGVVVP